MNSDLILMFGSFILLAISGLLVFCFTESKGENTAHARREDAHNPEAEEIAPSEEQSDPITH